MFDSRAGRCYDLCKLNMLNKIRRNALIIQCDETGRGALTRFLSADPVMNTFLLADVERYGFGQPFQTVWTAADSAGRIEGAALRYYGNLIVTGRLPSPLPEAALSGAATVMGPSDTVEELALPAERWAQSVRPLFCLRRGDLLSPAADAVTAAADDAGEIHRFLLTIPQFRTLYGEGAMIANRIRSGEGSHVFLRRDGALTAHANSAAVNDFTAMLGGVCVRPDCRGRGYARGLVSVLCRGLLEQNRLPCAFGDGTGRTGLFRTLGFEAYGQWAVSTRRQAQA